TISLYLLNTRPTPKTPSITLHDALPISAGLVVRRRARQDPLAHLRHRRVATDAADAGQHVPASHQGRIERRRVRAHGSAASCWIDRKSTRLNSSHVKISYAVFCLKKKI